MASFSLPPINDNPDGGWGPSSSNLPDQFKFKDIPYAPYSKSDKLGRFADWNDLSGDNRGTTVGLPSTQTQRGGGAGARGRRDGNQAFGSGTASAFAYFHVEDESSFSLVDNKAAPPRRGGFTRARGNIRGNTFTSRGNQRGSGRGAFVPNRGGQRGGRRGWRDWEKVIFLLLIKKICSYPNFRTIVLASLLWLFLLSGQCWKKLSSIALPS
jgi:translation initiation factor 3 subunit D